MTADQLDRLNRLVDATALPRVCEAEREALRVLLAERSELLKLAEVIEEWWLSGEMDQHYGAPAFVFLARDIVARASADSRHRSQPGPEHRLPGVDP